MSTSVFYGILIVLAIVSGLVSYVNKRGKRETKKSTVKQTQNIRTSNEVHSDEYILSSPIETLSWGDFERLLFLYFSENGYKVYETANGI